MSLTRVVGKVTPSILTGIIFYLRKFFLRFITLLNLS